MAHRFMYMLHTNALHIPHDKQVSHMSQFTLHKSIASSLEEAHVKNERAVQEFSTKILF